MDTLIQRSSIERCRGIRRDRSVPPEIREIFEDLYPPEYEHHRVIMLRAFFDASKTFPNDNPFPCLTIPGFVAEIPAWSTFQRQWRDARKESGIDFFHMTDFEANAYPYNTWSKRKRNAVISDLITLIKDTVEFGVAVALPKTEYDALSESTKKRFNDNPYSWVASVCVQLVAKHVKEDVSMFLRQAIVGKLSSKTQCGSWQNLSGTCKRTKFSLSYQAQKRSFPHWTAQTFWHGK